MRRAKRKRRLLKAIEAASSYAQWLEVAQELDELEGGAAWRADDRSAHLDSTALALATRDLTAQREKAEPLALAAHLHESLHRHMAEVTAPALYERSRVGTKHIVERYLDAVTAAIDDLTTPGLPGLPLKHQLALAEREARNVGRSALMLSGGASLGLFHIGVVKALWTAKLLPAVVSGASTGSMIAGGLCTRTDDELAEVFADPGRHIPTRVFRLLKVSEMMRAGVVMDRGQLLDAISANMADDTFLEAFQRTGRVLCIAVSPTRARQKPRLLCHETAPDVLVTSASLASCAIPGLFPPSTLLQRRGGLTSEYVAGERWVDGTVQTDLPTERLARLLNVNHSIVSQTNAHVLPFTQVRAKPGALSMVTDLVSSTAYAQGLQVLQVARRHARSAGMQRALDRVHGIADQRYMGDITILPRLTPWNYGVVLRNVSPPELMRLVEQGQRATWARMHVIDAQTRISRALHAGVQRLRNA